MIERERESLCVNERKKGEREWKRGDRHKNMKLKKTGKSGRERDSERESE